MLNQDFIPSSPTPPPKSIKTYTLKQLKKSPSFSPTKIIGFIRNTKLTNTGTIFLISDLTDNLNCSFFPNDAFEEEQAGLLEIGNLVRLIGNLRSFDNELSFSVNFVEKISDHNYITFHFLNVLNEIQYKNGGKINENKNDNLRNDILTCFRNNQDEKGLHIDLVIKMLSDKYTERDVRECINSLIDDCFIFSVDGDSYKTVD